MTPHVLELTEVPSVKVGMLIRREPAEVFQAIADPAITTSFWYTKSSGRMSPGTDLVWEWEMYGVSSRVSVKTVEENSHILFTWDSYSPDTPTTVEFRFTPAPGIGTYIQVTESGFTGTADQVVGCIADSTGGFAFVLSGLKALLEHDLVLGLILDAHPQGAEG